MSFGRYMQNRYGEKVHKVSIDAAFTCPNRDGTRGLGGCTFCNNASFSPSAGSLLAIEEQIARGKSVIQRRTGARKYLGYFQSYTNTYDEVTVLQSLYDRALSVDGVIGLSIGTRPDCVPDQVLDLLLDYQAQGHEIWLELGLQSAFDASLERVNRGHGFAEYRDACLRARSRGLKVCTHLIVGMPGEQVNDSISSLERVLDLGTDGLKVHPMHVVKGTQLGRQWKRGDYRPLTQSDYVATVVEMIKRLPSDVVVHRLTGTASKEMLLAPLWCEKKWAVLNEINAAVKRAA